MRTTLLVLAATFALTVFAAPAFAQASGESTLAYADESFALYGADGVGNHLLEARPDLHAPTLRLARFALRHDVRPQLLLRIDADERLAISQLISEGNQFHTAGTFFVIGGVAVLGASAVVVVAAAIDQFARSLSAAASALAGGSSTASSTNDGAFILAGVGAGIGLAALGTGMTFHVVGGGRHREAEVRIHAGVGSVGVDGTF